MDLDQRPLHPEVIHRYSHQPVTDSNGHLRWDWQGLVREMYRGLNLLLDTVTPVSIGIDTWGIDYGLLDAKGNLVAQPFSYRDKRTRGYRNTVELIGETELYRTSGLQLMPINTIFQLAAHDREELAQAEHLLMLPELLVYELTGEITTEKTSAGTTGLLDVHSGKWSTQLCEAINLNPALLSSIKNAGTQVGRWRNIPVHLVGGHDTASAVVAGGQKNHAFVSTGTWLLIGSEYDAPDTSGLRRRQNFSNEQGALSGIRLLKNIAGWWLLEECRKQWGNMSVETLLDEARTIDEDVPRFDPCGEQFIMPENMDKSIRLAAGIELQAPRAMVVRSIIESMAEGTANVVKELGGVEGISVFGGGVRADLYLNRLKHYSGLPVIEGPVEATALGNAMTQGITLGLWDNLDSARKALR